MNSGKLAAPGFVRSRPFQGRTLKRSFSVTKPAGENDSQNQLLKGIHDKNHPGRMPQCRQMRTCAKSLPASPALKAPQNPSAAGIFKKSSFCQRTQAPRDRENTDTFPGFLRFLASSPQVPAQTPDISQPESIHKLPRAQTRPPGQNTKSKKCETNRTQAQENSEAANPTNPARSAVFIRALIHVGPWPKKPRAISVYPPDTSPAPHRAIAARPADSATETECPLAGRDCAASDPCYPCTSSPRRQASDPGPESMKIRVAICAQDRTATRRPISLTLINVSNQIKLERAGRIAHTIG
jgi:hypothetical protein